MNWKYFNLSDWKKNFVEVANGGKERCLSREKGRVIKCSRKEVDRKKDR